MSDEMRECPFCGGKLFRTKNSVGVPVWKHPKVRCMISGQEVYEDDFDLWNTRPSAGPDEGLANELEKAARAAHDGFNRRKSTYGAIREPWECLGEAEKQLYRNMAADIIAALRSRPQPSAWRPISDIPDVPSGRHREFILAWESLKTGKRYSGSAVYLNDVELEMDHGQEEDQRFTGWFENKSDPDYEEFFVPFPTDGIRLIGWTDIPAPPAEGDAG